MLLILLLLGSSVVAQSTTGGSNESDTSSSALAITTSLELTVDGKLSYYGCTLRDSRANAHPDLWDIVIGPVSVANVTTTAQAMPVPASSLVPPPFLASYSFPTGQQVPQAAANSSWSFPNDFMLGVAGAAFQVEGAAKDEGRGPSVWDKLVRYVLDGSTKDTGLLGIISDS